MKKIVSRIIVGLLSTILIFSNTAVAASSEHSNADDAIRIQENAAITFSATTSSGTINKYGNLILTADGSFTWQMNPGIPDPLPVTITMKSKGGYAEGYKLHHISYNRSDYPDLTDEQYPIKAKIITDELGAAFGVDDLEKADPVKEATGSKYEFTTPVTAYIDTVQKKQPSVSG